MKPVIVSREWRTSTRILARLALTLSDGTGWDLSDEPRRSADVSLFVPYLEMPRDWPGTSIAWFTHHDASVRGKIGMWERADARASVRTWSAEPERAHLSDDGGPLVYVTPPLDRAHFTPVAKTSSERSSRPVVGTSGWNYAGGRKGSELFRRLCDRYGTRCTFSAAGANWPCATRLYDWSELPSWYRSLDLYVCTSLVEGVGYGPIEALACGIAIVVPLGVGVFDEFGDVPGIERYTAGDWSDLSAAVDRALASLPDVQPAELRAQTERYTAAAWCADWQNAVSLIAPRATLPEKAPETTRVAVATSTEEKLRQDDPRASQHAFRLDDDTRARSGVYVVAYGDPARRCAERLIGSLRVHMPGLAVCLVAEEPLGLEDVYREHRDEDSGARSVKTKMYDLAPAEWDYVLYLDADTQLIGPIDGVFQALADGWDVVACPNPERYVLVRDGVRRDNADEIAETVALIGSDEFIQLNGGVIGFRRSALTAALFRGWHTEWLVYGKRDQAALDRVIWLHRPRVWTLSDEFNRVVRYSAPSERTAITHHAMEARRWQEQGKWFGRLDEHPEMRAKREAWATYHPELDRSKLIGS